MKKSPVKVPLTRLKISHNDKIKNISSPPTPDNYTCQQRDWVPGTVLRDTLVFGKTAEWPLLPRHVFLNKSFRRKMKKVLTFNFMSFSLPPTTYRSAHHRWNWGSRKKAEFFTLYFWTDFCSADQRPKSPMAQEASCGANQLRP